MSDYDSGYDPKYGYNRNAFTHKTVGTAVMGRVVKLIVTPIGLVSEAVHARKDKGRSLSNAAAREAGLNWTDSEGASSKKTPSLNERQAEREDLVDVDGQPAFVDVPPEVANELIASGQAEPTEGQQPTHELVPDEKGDDGVDRDEAAWALDEAAGEQEDIEPVSTNEEDSENPEERLGKQMQASAAGGTISKSSIQNLPFPVIVPQRRPGTKTRGFVRAYSPVLEGSGISQDVFLGFLKNLHKAAQASPIFDVVMIATAIAGAYPDPIVGLGVQAVQVAAGIGQEIQERYRTNKFLTKANKDLFIPKGLYAMIVIYKTSGSEQPEVGIEPVDLGATAFAKYGEDVQPDTTVTESGGKEKPKMLEDVKEKMKQLRIASGETHGEAEMPVTCAPLIFPGLDAAAVASSHANEERKGEGISKNIKAKSKSTSKFVNDYYDRRAQASYVCFFSHLKPHLSCRALPHIFFPFMDKL